MSGLSGWCATDLPHPTDHARCGERVARGEIACRCGEHGGHESSSLLEESRSRGQGNRGAREILGAQEKTAPGVGALTPTGAPGPRRSNKEID